MIEVSSYCEYMSSFFFFIDQELICKYNKILFMFSWKI